VLRRHASHIVSFAAVLAITGCSSTPEEISSEPTLAEPELTLNLPEPTVSSCDCEALVDSDENYFDRGVRALAARDYDQAVRYFESHRLGGGTQEQREADVGMAFVTLMSKSLGADADTGSSAVDERAEIMVLALAVLATLEGRLETLDALNRTLSKDLEKREEALKRLRDLTLGQQES
jgi:hypothetical protein